MTITLVKLGGSLLTDKQVESSFRADIAQRIAAEIAEALKIQPDLRLIVGHGSGSFGHFAAKRYGTIEGVATAEQWRGFAEVATVAAELNHLVTQVFHQAGIPVWHIQPSASLICENGVVHSMELNPLKAAVEHGVIPLIYGDVALDTVRGGTIASTETIFTYLVQHLPVKQIVLVGEVAGVYDPAGQVIPEITPDNFQSMRDFLGGSAGTDVTGGMLTKVSDMLALTQQIAGLTVSIIDGTQPGILRDTLSGKIRTGTLIRAG